MGFSPNAFAKIKTVDKKENYTKAKIVISKKIKNSDPVKYECAFAGWATFVGKAHLCNPIEGQKIKILNCDVTNGYLDREGNQQFNKSPQYTIFSYELQNSGGSEYNPYVEGGATNFEALSQEDDLPF